MLQLQTSHGILDSALSELACSDRLGGELQEFFKRSGLQKKHEHLLGGMVAYRRLSSLIVAYRRFKAAGRFVAYMILMSYLFFIWIWMHVWFSAVCCHTLPCSSSYLLLWNFVFLLWSTLISSSPTGWKQTKPFADRDRYEQHHETSTQQTKLCLLFCKRLLYMGLTV